MEEIIIGCDHAAYKLKEKIKEFIENNKIKVFDLGAYSEEPVDYPEKGIKLASLISKGDFKRGILLCGTGIGMSMVANRFPCVRAALCGDIYSALMSRRHNDSNVLVIGGRVIGEALALEIVRVWLNTDFEGGRHLKRVEIFDNISKVKISEE